MFIGFVFVLSAHAQDKDKAILLKTVFETISKQHKVTFNYIEEEIAIFKIIPPQNTLSLEQKIAYISVNTKLEFKYVSANYISVYNNKKLDKPMCAFLLDETTKEAVAFATVRITASNYATTSNEKGYFELAINSPNAIEISHVNYYPITLQPQQLYLENCPTFTLKPILNELEEVQTEVFLTKGVAKKIDGSYEIKPKKFGMLPGLTEADVFQTMLQLPGIMSVDETISNINVRGGTHDQNLFLWNGIRLFQTGHFYGLISVLNPNLAQKISINKNGSSAFFE